MDQNIIYALKEIANCLNKPDYLGIVSIIISFLGFITTCIVIVFNYRTIKLTRIEIQKSIDTQLYDRRFVIIDHIEKNNYSDSLTEVSLLFGEAIAEEISQLINIINEKNYYNQEKQEYRQLISNVTDVEGQEFYKLYLKMEKNPENLSSEENERYDELYSSYGAFEYWSESDDMHEYAKKYDIKEIWDQEKQLQQRFSDLHEKVLEDLKGFMKETLLT